MLPAVLMTIVLALLAVFQLALVAGAPWGRFAWGGKERVLSRNLRIGSVVSVAIYALIAVVALDRAGVIDVLPDLVSRIAIWVVFGYFCLGIVLNGISRSRPERFTMTPVTLVLAVLSLLVALG
ncbi:MAG: hypothetical protein ABI566_02930 [Pseudolysinimonas sp.]